MMRERGFQLERKVTNRRNGQPRVDWEVVGVPEDLVTAMSSRSSEIEDLKRKFTEEYGRDAEGPAWEAWIVKQRGRRGKYSPLELPVAQAVDHQRLHDERVRREAEGRPFDEHQAAAVRLAVSGRRFVSITGPAGTGKGAASAAIARLMQTQGRRVIALAVPGRT